MSLSTHKLILTLYLTFLKSTTFVHSTEFVAFHNSKVADPRKYDYSHLTTIAVWGDPETEFTEEFVDYIHNQNTSIQWVIGDGFVNRHRLHETEYRNDRVQALIEICDLYNLDGINVDVEQPIFRDLEKRGVLDFTKELYIALKNGENKTRYLTWDVPVNPDQLDCFNGRCLYWKEMSAFVDYYYVMGYDAQTIPYKTQVTDPLPALLNGYSEWAKIVSGTGGSKKLVALVPWYASKFKCHFRKPEKSNDRCYTDLLTDMVQVDYKDLWSMVSASETRGYTIVYDQKEESNMVLFREKGNYFKLVFDDLRTLKNKLDKTAVGMGLGGVGMWQAGSLDYGEKYGNLSMAYWKLMDDTVELMGLKRLKNEVNSSKFK